MWQRIKTAVVLVAIVGFALFASALPIFVVPLLSVAVLIAAHEWTKLMPKWRVPAQFVLAVLLLTMASIFLPVTWVFWWMASICIWILALTWVLKYPAQQRWYGRRLATIGVIVLTAAMSAMYGLWQMSPWWLMYVFLLVWCADSGAYFVGRKFGKRKLSPHVSPNKSVEGLMGGVAVAGLVAAVVGYYVELSGLALVLFLLLSAVTVMASVLGDLFESMLKRRADIKDSGNILPGHGGVLDRIDSLLSATPIFAFGFWLLVGLGVFDEAWVQSHSAVLHVPFYF